MGNLAPALPARPAGAYALVDDRHVCAHDYVCRHGARSPALGGAYTHASVSVILAGTFRVRAPEGTALVGPGALLLGNPAAEYEFTHVDDGGDRSLGFEYAPATLDGLAAAAGVHLRAGRPFRGASLPASPASAGAVVLAREALRTGDAELLREASLAVATAALTAAHRSSAAAFTRAHTHRVARVLRRIDADPAADCSLDTLAAVAGLSPYHFLRLFRALTGQTPRQHVIAARLRTAALALRTTTAPVLSIALAAGFGDASHFHATFLRAFALSPAAYRRRHAVSS